MNHYFNRRRPKYNDDTDYTTNAPSYYDDLAKKEKLIEYLANKIWEYEEKLNMTLDEIKNVLNNYITIIDGKLKVIDNIINEGFNDRIEELLREWILDGSLDKIINETLFNELNLKIDRINDIFINVKTFGAKGNGTTDDTNSIHDAINELKRLGGGILFFPKGVYIVDFVLKIDVDCIVKGAGIGQSIVKVKNQSKLFHNTTRTENANDVNLDNLFRDYHSVFFFLNCNFTIENIEIDGNGVNQFERVGNEDWNFVDPAMSGAPNHYRYFHGIKVIWRNKTSALFNINNCKVTNCTWANIDIGNQNLNNVDVTGSKINNNIIGSCPHDGISIHMLSNLNVYENEFYNPNTHSLHLYYNVSNIYVSNNNFQIKNGIIIFKPFKLLDHKTSILIGHNSYDGNIVNNINVDSNNFLVTNNQLVEYVSAIIIARNVSDLTINKNKILNYRDAISMNYLVLGVFVIDDNIMKTSYGGIILRPFLNTGVLKSLGSVIPKPYDFNLFVKNNLVTPINKTDSNRGISLIFTPDKIPDDVGQFNIYIENNNFKDSIYNIVYDKFFKLRTYISSLNFKTKTDILQIPPNTNKNYVIKNSNVFKEYNVFVYPEIELNEGVNFNCYVNKDGEYILSIFNITDENIVLPENNWNVTLKY